MQEGHTFFIPTILHLHESNSIHLHEIKKSFTGITKANIYKAVQKILTGTGLNSQIIPNRLSFFSNPDLFTDDFFMEYPGTRTLNVYLDYVNTNEGLDLVHVLTNADNRKHICYLNQKQLKGITLNLPQSPKDKTFASIQFEELTPNAKTITIVIMSLSKPISSFGHVEVYVKDEFKREVFRFPVDFDDQCKAYKIGEFQRKSESVWMFNFLGIHTNYETYFDLNYDK
ncbi:hypothetical protein GPJ56_002841 [Histomonas meleagridis]|uniref:uncharacterized protein n=1 Tax=Histomonas meleagridis TaxID=135588 RepID=UPI0035599588|nr:hypothetical protein GPJ56_002841 [Histomonas meleagridis]KAH0806357.1 hypothetical protein GO595_001045 [Histomonas meleagridis]